MHNAPSKQIRDVGHCRLFDLGCDSCLELSSS